MSKISYNDLDKYEEESKIERFKKKGSNPSKKHNKNKYKKRKGFVDSSEIDW